MVRFDWTKADAQPERMVSKRKSARKKERGAENKESKRKTSNTPYTHLSCQPQSLDWCCCIQMLLNFPVTESFWRLIQTHCSSILALHCAMKTEMYRISNTDITQTMPLLGPLFPSSTPHSSHFSFSIFLNFHFYTSVHAGECKCVHATHGSTRSYMVLTHP